MYILYIFSIIYIYIFFFLCERFVKGLNPGVTSIFILLLLLLLFFSIYSVDIVDEEPHFVGYPAINHYYHYYYYYYHYFVMILLIKKYDIFQTVYKEGSWGKRKELLMTRVCIYIPH